MKIKDLLSESQLSELGTDVEEGRYGSRDAYQRDYDSSRTGFSRGRRDDDEYHVPDPSPSHDHARKETSLYNIKVGGQAVNPKPILGRSNAIAWAKHAIAQGQFTAAEATLSPVHGVSETATAGSTSAGNVGVGAVYKNKPAKTPKNKDGTAKNALDLDANLITGGSIKR